MEEKNQSQNVIQLSPLINDIPISAQSSVSICPISQYNTSFSDCSSILPKDEFLIQKHPQIITKDDTIFTLIQTHQSTHSPGQLTATYSKDNGETWMERVTISHNITSFTHPNIDATGDPAMQVYGSHQIDVTTGAQLIFGIPNISNPDMNYEGSTEDFTMYQWFNGRILSWDQGYWKELGDIATAGYPHGTDVGPYKNFHGLTIWAGHDGIGWSIYYFCDTDETIESPYKFLWKNYLNGTIEHVDIDIDLATGWEYDLFERINERTHNHEIILDMLYLEPGNPTWYTNEDNYGVSHVFTHYRNPSLKASDGYVYMVCEKDDDIFIHYSHDIGFTFSTSQLTNTDDDETQADVTAKGNSVTVTFVKDNNLYFITSADGGVTWSTPEQINEEGEISMENDNVDIHGETIAMILINETLYINQVDIETSNIVIDQVQGGITVEATVKNTGSIAAMNIPYSITIEGGFLLSTRSSIGNITIPAGETRTIKTEMITLGIGNPTIKVQVGSTSASVSATIFFFYIFV